MNESLAQHPLAHQFNRLAPDLVLDAVDRAGSRTTGRFLVLNSYENRVYQFETEAGWVIGKFYRPGRWSRDTLRDEHRFLAELAAEEIPVACPVPLQPDGDTIGLVDGIFYSVFPRIGGRNPQELDREQIRILGRLVARIHNVGARSPAAHRLRLDPATYGRANLDWLLSQKVIPAEAEAVFSASVEALLGRIDLLFTDVPYLRIHGDCHLGNLVWSPAGPTFLDFDDFCNGPAVQDVWMMVPSADQEGQRQRHEFVDAYSGIRGFEPVWLRLVEPLRALRFIHYATWIARRWHDPFFQRTFSHFGTVQYWQKEVQDLREQIARIDQFL